MLRLGLLVCALALAGLSSWSAEAASPVPSSAESELLHRRLELEGVVEWRGGQQGWMQLLPSKRPPKVTVLHLWSPRCGPCVAELPLLSRMIDAWRSEPAVRFLVVADHGDDGDGSELLAFVQSHPALWRSLPLLRLRDQRLRDALGVAVQPLTMLLDEQKVVRQVFVGPLSGRNLGSAIARLREAVR